MDDLLLPIHAPHTRERPDLIPAEAEVPDVQAASSCWHSWRTVIRIQTGLSDSERRLGVGARTSNGRSMSISSVVQFEFGSLPLLSGRERRLHPIACMHTDIR
jgi:hypothetical protein